MRISILKPLDKATSKIDLSNSLLDIALNNDLSMLKVQLKVITLNDIHLSVHIILCAEVPLNV